MEKSYGRGSSPCKGGCRGLWGCKEGRCGGGGGAGSWWGGGVGGKSLGCLPMEVDFASGEPQTILEQGPDLVVFISLVCSGGWTDGGEAPEGEARG